MLSSIIRIRHPEPHPAAPWADHTLTSIMFFFLGVVLYMGRTMPAGYVPEFLTNIGLTTLAIPLCKRVFGSLAPFIGTKEAVSKPRNTRKFCDQSWQLVVHVAMTLYELRILGRAETAWTWWNNPGGENGCWTPDPPQASDDQLRSFYLMQLGIWFYTAFSCRFVESRHKDYFVMYTHHIVTIMLVGISFAQGTLRIGLLVLLIHDASDIVADLLKMANYMGLDEKSGLYLTEILFVGNLVSWIWLRLWLYPSHVIMTVWRDTERFYNPPSGFNTAAHVGIFACWAFLSVLFLMHIYWFCLFVRIAVRLLKASEDAHQAGAAEYEGGSEDESSGGEEEEEMKKKKKK